MAYKSTLKGKGKSAELNSKNNFGKEKSKIHSYKYNPMTYDLVRTTQYINEFTKYAITVHHSSVGQMGAIFHKKKIEQKLN